MTMLKWAKSEENLALRDVFSKVFEVSSMWTAVWRDFSEEVPLCFSLLLEAEFNPSFSYLGV